MNADRLARLTTRNGNHGRDKQPRDAGVPEGLEPWQPGAPTATEPGPGDGAEGNGGTAAPPGAEELELLRQENGELRCANVQLRELLEQAEAERESWARRER